MLAGIVIIFILAGFYVYQTEFASMGCKTGMTSTANGAVYICSNGKWQRYSGGGIGGATTTLPFQAQPGTPLIKCPSDRKISFSVLVEDSLDEEASPQTLLDETVYIISSAGQQLDKQNTSVTSATTMSIPCTKDTVKFVTKGDDMYTTDKITVRNSEYTGATVPTYETREGVPVGFVLEPALVRAKKFGSVYLQAWNDNPLQGSDLYNVTVLANGNSLSFIHFTISEITDDTAIQGPIVCLNYTESMVDKWYIYGDDSRDTAERNDKMIADDYADCEEAWVLKRDGKPLVIDADDRTADPVIVEYIAVLYGSSTDPAFNMTIKAYDSEAFLQASGLKIGFAYNGEWRPNDDDKVNLGIQVASEGSAILQIL